MQVDVIVWRMRKQRAVKEYVALQIGVMRMDF